MIILITGATHTGKTNLAQRLLEKYKFPYISQDNLKMGLIRAKLTNITPEDSIEKIREVVWPLTREIIKTNIENRQNLILEGCYVPFDYKKDFKEEYLKEIKFISLVFSEDYINKNYEKIIRFENIIEKRLESEGVWATKELLIKENKIFLREALENDLEFILIDKDYERDLDKIKLFLKFDNISKKYK